MAMLPMKIKTFYEPVFRVEVGILICPASEFDKHTKRLNIEGIGTSHTTAGAVYPLVDSKGCKSWLVWFAKKPTFNDIVHESWHLTDHILESRGVEYQAKGANETFAYYQEFWADKIKEAFK